MMFKRYRVMLTALVSMSLAFMTAAIANAQSCNDATIEGTCVLQAVASPTTAGLAAGGGPETLVGQITFDGAGNYKMRLHKNANGKFVQAEIIGTYTVQSNCDGSYTYTNATTGDTDIHDFVISPSGHVLREILRSTKGRPETLRVTAGICKFDE